MASFSMPPAHQARRKQQATEDPEYENKIQEVMKDLHSRRFKSIWAEATTLGVSPFSNVATPSYRVLRYVDQH